MIGKDPFEWTGLIVILASCVVYKPSPFLYFNRLNTVARLLYI